MSAPLQFPAVTVSHKTFTVSVPAMEIASGEILGIFGKSGSGKTTYLQKIREHFSSERVHYMSQADCLLEECTIRQNIELGLVCCDKSSKEFLGWEKTFARLLSELEIDRHLHKLPRMMSGGQRKRAEIARCLMMDPEILLLDEPFQGIGHLFEAVTSAYILARTKCSAATVIVSHDFPLLCKFCDRVLLMDDQGVIGFAPTKDSRWRPDSPRAAWTLGVENVVPSDTPHLRIVSGATADPRFQLAFWAQSARWIAMGSESSDAGLVLSIDRSSITSERTYLIHGVTYTHIELGHAQIELNAVGIIPEHGDILLCAKDHWRIPIA
ncbi:ATP-binding cassette domain-containing protein [Candidatus Peribacteria bacterium]|nr:ATP-binding cassette domain-containing protein [Candidatus Peribacteria bacterium]